MSPEYDEESIVAQLQDPQRCREAFALVVKHYSQSLYWQIRKMVISHDDADDLLQNTFLKAWSNIAYFRGDARLSTWLYRIAVNETLTFLTKQRQQNNIPLDGEDSFLVDRLESDEWFDGDEAQRKLQKAILQLPEKQRLIFNMHYFDEMKYEDISQVLGTSVGALKASYHHAVKKIEKFLTSVH
ncbi:MAG: RNA polymerase sigma factor [Porphyromonadaceae bacterium]|nr:RNA polymerase sigma factor [Porphyromonadaceae bacterium]MCD8287362.1 RNA polymerase sigma factor [Porphyromonadaceae bacterium]